MSSLACQPKLAQETGERRLAEREGFEPPCRLPGKTLSRRALITPLGAKLLAARSRSSLRDDAPPALACRGASEARRPREAAFKNGGEGGIRTPVPVTRQDAFEAPPLRPLRYLSGSVRHPRMQTARSSACSASTRTRHYTCRGAGSASGGTPFTDWRLSRKNCWMRS